MTADELAVMIAFAEARLNEDEAAARACADSGGSLEWIDSRVMASGDHTIRTRPGARVVARVRIADTEASDGSVIDPDACAAHIPRYDPARVLRDVAAKRARIERYKRAVEVGGANPSPFVRGQDNGYAEACLDSIRDDVAAWSDHPEYQEGWKP